MLRRNWNLVGVTVGAIALAVGLLGCETFRTLETPVYALRIANLDMPLQTVQNLIVATLPVGLRGTSSNGREFLSKYFVLTEDGYKPASDALDRYYAQISVLGDARPYDVEVFVTREKRTLDGENFTYAVVGHDMRLAKRLQSNLQAKLTKRREQRNIIDDFRAF